MDNQPVASRLRSNPLAAVLAGVAGALTLVLRLVPHPANFTSMGALGVFSGARLRSWQAFAIPVGVMVLSDFALWCVTGFDDRYSLFHISRSYVYASLLLYVVIGRMIAHKASFLWIVGASLLGSLQFFLVTNFFEWLFQPLHWHQIPEPYRYPRDLSGLVACFVAALPFFQADYSFSVLHLFTIGDVRLGLFGTFVGDLLFTGLLFGTYGVLSRTARQPERPELEPAVR
jgi:hypothetical protein